MIPELFHYPLASSTACRIAAVLGDVAVTVQRVDVYSKSMSGGGSLFDVSPLGKLPVLRLANGHVLSENTAVLLWIQAQSGSVAFRRAPDSDAYYELVGWLSFCATELHAPVIGPLLRPETPPDMRSIILQSAPVALRFADNRLEYRRFLLGDEVSAADAYLLWCLLFCDHVGADMAPFENLASYSARLLEQAGLRRVVEEDRSAALADIETHGIRPFCNNPRLAGPAAP